MPKVDIDYSNTIFYKIHCKNSDVKDIYIGHTTNFVQRKHAHKRSCINTRSVNFNCKVYTIIREFGGWNNWKMEIIAFHDCVDHYAARVIEQQYFEEYNATMNSIEPFPKPKVIVPKEPRIKTERKLFYCEMCNVYFPTQSTHDKHNQTNKHIKTVAMQKISSMETNMSNRFRMKKTPKTPTEFSCDTCNFKCSNKRDYGRHILTAKHNTLTDTYEILTENTQKYVCGCGKIYSHRQSLYTHKKKCIIQNGQTLSNNLVNSNIPSENEDTRDELIERLVTSDKEMKSMIHLLLEKYQESQIQIQESQLQYQESQLQNQELMSKMIDVMPQMGNTTNNNSHNTTNNNTLNFYLTNTCKDAESIHDFTERFVKRSVDFFKGNYIDVAHNQIDLASNVYDIFKNCLDENPQTKKFVQTTDAKNGVLYIKEKQKDENKQLCGEAEFIKHMDGFEKAGTNISHAINCAFIPVQDNYKEIMERECGKEPIEDDYEDEDQYERDMDIYKEKTGDLKRHLLVQSFNAVCLFDAKKRRNEILEKTRRLKE